MRYRSGVPGMGDDALIYALTLFTLPTNRGPQKLGHCRGCQLMRAGTHPDLLHPGPEKGKICWALMRYVRSPKS